MLVLLLTVLLFTIIGLAVGILWFRTIKEHFVIAEDEKKKDNEKKTAEDREKEDENEELRKEFENIAEIYFMDKEETYRFIIDDDDGFIRNMNQLSLESRTTLDQDMYKQYSAVTAVSFLPKEIEVLTEYAHRVDSFLRVQDPKRFKDLPAWNFALVSGTTYEKGQSHVRGKKRDVYVLSDNMVTQQLWDHCQLKMTLLYMRMETFFPPNTKKNVQYLEFTPPLEVPRTKFPSNWNLESIMCDKKPHP